MALDLGSDYGQLGFVPGYFSCWSWPFGESLPHASGLPSVQPKL